MTQKQFRAQGLLARVWQFMLDTSEAAVAIHYRQSWNEAAPQKPALKSANDADVKVPEALAA